MIFLIFFVDFLIYSTYLAVSYLKNVAREVAQQCTLADALAGAANGQAEGKASV